MALIISRLGMSKRLKTNPGLTKEISSSSPTMTSSAHVSYYADPFESLIFVAYQHRLSTAEHKEC